MIENPLFIFYFYYMILLLKLQLILHDIIIDIYKLDYYYDQFTSIPYINANEVLLIF